VKTATLIALLVAALAVSALALVVLVLLLRRGSAELPTEPIPARAESVAAAERERANERAARADRVESAALTALDSADPAGAVAAQINGLGGGSSE